MAEPDAAAAGHPAPAAGDPPPLRIHWRLPLNEDAPPGSVEGARPDLPALVAFCRLAERSGIDSLLLACGAALPDPVPLAAALGPATERVRFLLAHRPGLVSPTLFVQQVNTVAALAGGRVSLNLVIGHSEREQRAYGDTLPHDARYRRADELLAVCRALWEGREVDFAGEHLRVERARLALPFAGERGAPEIYLSGSSEEARAVARRHADCWLTLGKPPVEVAAEAAPLVAAGVEVGMRLSLVLRPRRADAVRAAYELAGGGDAAWVRRVFVEGSVAEGVGEAFARAGERDGDWFPPCGWRGLVAARGPSAIALVGSPEDVAAAILAYRDAGVSQLIFSGWPSAATLELFAAEVLPRVRAGEAAGAAAG
ncbi:MAG TPA: LLM class flavin-dependent oxidoreductase [Thermoanaerobaculia bacterium]|nr:LLM class flavin-dependent oxidoreductase [Thermoanaerobaculia bacterium]